jgi:TusA-related sulfurtransferase
MSIHTLDVSKEHCPMTYVKTKIALSKLSVGEVLEVLVTDGEPLENIPKSASEQGFKVLSVQESDTKGLHLISIQK